MATVPISSVDDPWRDDRSRPVIGSRNRPRVTIITRRYWPHGASETAARAVRLADHLAHCGMNVQVAVPAIRGGCRHPTFAHRSAVVHLGPSMPRSAWASGRYVRSWTAFLQDLAASSDMFVGVGGRDEAVAAIAAAAKASIGIAVWPTMVTGESDVAHWQTSTASRRYAGLIKRSDRVVADNPVGLRMLAAQGIAPERLIQIDPIVRIGSIGSSSMGSGSIGSGSTGSITSASTTDPPAESSDDSPTPSNDSLHRPSRSDARRCLAAVNADLTADPRVPVITTTAAMVRGGELDAFAAAMMSVSAAHDDANFWILGDGPARSRIYNRLRGDGLASVVAMPGSFNDSIDLLTATDIFVHLDAQPTAGGLIDAIQCRLPLVIRDSPPNRSMLDRFGITRCDAVHWCDGTPPSIKRATKTAITQLRRRWPDPVPPYGPPRLRPHSLASGVSSWSALVQSLARSGSNSV